MFEVVKIHQRCFHCKQPFREGEVVKIWHRPWKFKYGKQEKKAMKRGEWLMHADGFLIHSKCEGK